MKRLKSLASYVIILLTIGVFAYYIHSHREIITQLRATKWTTVVAVLGLYTLMTANLVVLYDLMLEMCGVKISPEDNILLTMYSNVINFFGPLQSGPGFRVVYLKKRFNVRVKSYLGANLLYYAIFSVISGLFLLSGLISSWILLVLLICGLVVTWIVLPPLSRQPRFSKFVPDIVHARTIGLMCLATLTQLFTVTGVYYVEISSLQRGVSFAQAIIYAGAANFSLFVSLTPGALGFRESFLYFSQRLHHINSATIVSANILDRGLYVLFLGITFLVILAVHGKQRLENAKGVPIEE